MSRDSFHTPARRWSTMLLIAVVALGAACSQEPERPPRDLDPTDDVGLDADVDLDSGTPDTDADAEDSGGGDADDSDVDAQDPDASDADAEDPDVDASDAEDADTDLEDADTGDGGDGLPSACADAIIDLGVLENGSNLVALTPELDSIEKFVVCPGAAEDEQVIVQFELPEDGKLSFIGLETSPALLQTPCSSAGAFCVEQGLTLNVIAGLPVFVAVDLPAEAVTLEVVFTPVEACSPAGQQSCLNSEEITACTTGFISTQVPTWVTIPCPAGCESDACAGDSCQNPIVVDSSIAVQMYGESLSNTFDNLGAPNCIWDTPSEGRELVFQVNDVEVGETIVVTINDPLRFYRVSILQTCSASAECLESRVPGSVLEYEATEAGTYFVIVDAEMDVPSAPEISVEVNATSDI